MPSLRVIRILLLALGTSAAVEPSLASAAESAGQTSTSSKKSRSSSDSDAKWIKHKVVPGERLDDIAKRYGVTREAVTRWNKSVQAKGWIYAGQTLRIHARRTPPPRKLTRYTVKSGDTWARIARRFGVDAEDLQSWNPKVPKAFRAGTKLTVYTNPKPKAEPEPALAEQTSEPAEGVETEALATAEQLSGADPLGFDAAAEEAATNVDGSAAAEEAPKSDEELLENFLAFSVRPGGVSVGRPNRGRLLNGVQLPESDLYTVRNPDEAWGSSHTILQLQTAIANFRRSSGYEGQLVIGAISKRSGGRFRPHKSHQSGRDIDIKLPKKAWAPKDSSSPKVIDWKATWHLIKAFVETNEVEYIFLDYSRQRYLIQAAKASGASAEEIRRLIQFPNGRGSNNGFVRHSQGHSMHIHVRIKCASGTQRCESY